jgi:uncharacterized protein with HEPN domain
MSRSTTDYLRHILDEADFVLEHGRGLTLDEFLGDEMRKRAFVRSLEVIGEATKNLPETFRREHDQVDWRSVAGMRDRLIHGYFGVDYEIVWDVVETKLPAFREEIRRLLAAEDQ